MSEVLQIIARVRRAMPRNADVMAICSELERLLTEPKRKLGRALTRAEIQRNYRLRKKAQVK